MNFDKIKGWVADTMVSIVAAKEHVAKVDQSNQKKCQGTVEHSHLNIYRTW